MGLTIEEMKLVDSTQAQLDQLVVQVANREAAMAKDAANAALIQFKTYFASREFSLTGNDWNVSATHGSINFSIAVKNAQSGGIECLILKFPEMVRKQPLAIFLEEQAGQANEKVQVAVDNSKGPLAEVLEKVSLMRERLAAPPKKWQYYSQQDVPGAVTPQRRDYSSFRRLLEEECP